MDLEQTKTFILAGHAIFTIRSMKTQVRYTYKVVKHRTDDVWFVNLLVNPDEYMLVGTIQNRPLLKTIEFYKIRKFKENFVPAVAFRWMFQQIFNHDKLPENMEFWHESRCARCGRPLTVPESIEDGLGPECRKLVCMAV